MDETSMPPNEAASEIGQCLPAHSAQLEYLEDGFLDQIVGAGGAGGDSDGYGSLRGK